MPSRPDLTLSNVRVPACLVDGRESEHGDLALDIEIRQGTIAAISEPGTATASSPPTLSAWPGFVDLHTHLDKGHIWPRAENPDGSFDSALEAVRADRHGNWSAEDVRRRFDFALRCAFVHGTVAMRTHLDCEPPQHRISFPVFRELREEWAGRITLQAVSLLPIDQMEEPLASEIADLTADAEGVLGAVTYMLPDLAARLDRVFALAADRGLDLDFHVDETGDPDARSLHDDRARRSPPSLPRKNHLRPLLLAGNPAAAGGRGRHWRWCSEVGISVVSLPMCNLYLQDRTPGRTPRWRGITLLHELAAQGTPVALASDNCRDPFYAYGDHDMLEVFREAVRIGHLDRPLGAWPQAVTATPADIMGLDHRGRHQ